LAIRFLGRNTVQGINLERAGGEMMEIVQVLNSLNWQGIAAIFIASWYFTRDIKAQLVKLDEDLRAQGKRTDQLYQIIVEMMKDRK